MHIQSITKLYQTCLNLLSEIDIAASFTCQCHTPEIACFLMFPVEISELDIFEGDVQNPQKGTFTNPCSRPGVEMTAPDGVDIIARVLDVGWARVGWTSSIETSRF